MDNGTKALFIDTNGFIQVRDLKDIPWRNLFPGVKAVDVMIAQSVIRELDRHKNSTNQRRRDRARLALQVIDSASRTPDLAVVLRDGPIRVRLVISTVPRLDWSSHPNLDPINPDDQLVAEALSFGNSAAVFSHDTGPRIRARIVGINAFEPDAKWLLPIEQTDDQRENARLRRDLERALSQSPKIIAGFEKFDEATSEIRLILPIVRPLDHQQVDRLVGHYLAQHPKASFPPTSPFGLGLLGISETAIERYYDAYSTFETNVLSYYTRLNEHVQRIGEVAAINYYVKNDSGVAAEGLRIEFDLDGNASLIAEREEAIFGKACKLPEPPEPPRAIGDFNPALRGLATLHDHARPRDPVAFYWFNRPNLISDHSALQCQEFRATKELNDQIFIMALDEPPAEYGLRLHISATNLPSPLEIRAKVILVRQPAEWCDPAVQAILPEDIRTLISPMV
jgi:PIN domain